MADFLAVIYRCPFSGLAWIWLRGRARDADAQLSRCQRAKGAASPGMIPRVIVRIL